MKNTIKLAIKLNQSASIGICLLCGNGTNPNIGAELVDDSTNQPVCHSCGFIHAPLLVALLNLSESARFFINAEQDFGLQQETLGLDWNLFDESDNITPFSKSHLGGAA